MSRSNWSWNGLAGRGDIAYRDQQIVDRRHQLFQALPVEAERQNDVRIVLQKRQNGAGVGAQLGRIAAEPLAHRFVGMCRGQQRGELRALRREDPVRDRPE